MPRKNILTQRTYAEKYADIKEHLTDGTVDLTKPIKVIIAAGDAKGCAGGQLFLDILDDLSLTYEYDFVTHQQTPTPETYIQNVNLLEEMFDIDITINEYDILDLTAELEDGGLGGFESEHFKHARLRKFIIPTTGQDHITLFVTGHTGMNNRTHETSDEFRQTVDDIIVDTPPRQYAHLAPWGSNLYITASALDTATAFTEEGKAKLKTLSKPDLFSPINPSLYSDLPMDTPQYWQKLRKLFDDNSEEVERIKQWEIETQREFLRPNFMEAGNKSRSLWGLWNECMQKSIPTN